MKKQERSRGQKIELIGKIETVIPQSGVPLLCEVAYILWLKILMWHIEV